MTGSTARRTAPRLSRSARAGYGRRFGANAELYDAVRPGYPFPAREAVLASAAGSGETGLRVCDLGAGTGLLTRDLITDPRVAEVIAVDPDEQLLEHNPGRCLTGTAESIPLPDDSVDLVTAAQVWHWFDPAEAPAEIARVLRPHGRLGILVNQLDVRIPWVLRLSRIMHAGDVYRPGWQPRLGPGWRTAPTLDFPFATTVTTDEVVALAATRTYWLRSSEQIRARVEANIREFLTTEVGFDTTGAFELPYLCLVALAQPPTR